MMRGFWGAASLLVALSTASAGTAAATSGTVEIVLTSAGADAAKLQSLVDCVAVTPDGVALVGDGDRLWQVGAEGAKAISKFEGIRSFAFTPGGLLIAVRGRELVYLDPAGDLKPFFTVPAEGMSVVPGQGESLFLYGPEGRHEYGLYVVRPGRRVSKVLRSAKAITAVAQFGGATVLVADGALYGVVGSQLKLLAGEPQGDLISVAVDASGGRMFVSDYKHVFRIDQGAVVPLTNDMGGTLRWYGGGLLVLDAKRRVLVRLVGML
jgi:hypothetical protein